ncbi:MAG: RagB/SusD family nutrient uptake outer membrane protein [Bacteroidaceae bacterium]|nr:RagB/SusD family nutrient uptake outer membrane protein [Bacteroidaceae bacterium]
MKLKIFVLGLIVSVVFMGQSCTKLEDTSYTSILAEQFSPTGDDLASLLGAAYVPWRQTFLLWNGVARAQMLPSDEDVIPARPNGWVDGGVYKRMHQHKWTTEDDVPLEAWNRTYVGINACNRVLYQIESGQIDIGDQKDAVISELKVLRASYYYILVDLFGNVPLVTKFDVEDGYLPEQSTRQEVYEFIIDEITSNIDNLKEDVNTEYYGRFNKWAAYTLLAKMYLNSEVFSNGTHSDYDKCIEACNKVIESGKYALESEQSKVFITKNENSSEIIFALPIDAVYVKDWNAFDFHCYSLDPANQSTYNFTETPWGGVCCIPQYIDTFDPDDERLQSSFIQGQQYSIDSDSLKCTMGSMIGQPLAYINEVSSIDASQEVHGFRWGKFEYAIGSTNVLSNDFPLFRYADVLLMKAEALLRTGDANDAATLVTEVRKRNFTNHPEKAIVTGEQLEEGSCYDYGRRDTSKKTEEGGADIKYGRFLDELGWEFTQEGRRRQDMVRFGVFTSKSWFSHDADGDKTYLNLYPIPNAQLLTNANLKQNSGY